MTPRVDDFGLGLPWEDDELDFNDDPCSETSLPGNHPPSPSIPSEEDNPVSRSDYFGISYVASEGKMRDRDFDLAVKISRIAAQCNSGDLSISSAVSLIHKTATQFNKIESLAKEFVKGRDKKSITKRSVIAFLDEKGEHSWMSSDMIRCLRQYHNIHVADSLLRSKLASIRDSVIDIEVVPGIDLKTASTLRRVSAHLAHVLAAVERLET